MSEFMKHFETATIGAKGAANLLRYGEIVSVETRTFNVAALAREILQREAIVAVYADGSEREIPGYAGDTPERIRAIAAAPWDAADEAAFKAAVAEGRFGDYPDADSTGARVRM